MSTMTTDTGEALRAWARGMYPLEAGVELLLHAFGGRFADPGWPWVLVDEDGWAHVDAEAIAPGAGALSGGERRVLAVVASLLDSRCPCSLTDVLPGLDRDALGLVLAAVAHAGGSHEHSELVHDDEGGGRRLELLGPLYPWPAD